MTKLNNKGFAVSTILYGILALTILILMLIFGIMRASKDMNEDLVESIETNLNNCVLEEVNLEGCYYNGDSCSDEEYLYYICIDKGITLRAQILVDNIAYADNTESPNVNSATGIDFSKTSTYVGYSETVSSETQQIDFDLNTKYYYGTDYFFNESTGFYTLTGTKISKKWSDMSSDYNTYPYTCRSQWSQSECSNLYKMTGYISQTSGKGYRYKKSNTKDKTFNNGKGLYYTSTNTENSKTTYYFRGDVENNYVSFGTYAEGYSYTNEFSGKTVSVKSGDPIIWRIVRINEDGSIRLIKQDGIANSPFNSGTGGNVYLGYMYGTIGADNYALTHSNITNSTIKNVLDSWYAKHLSPYYNLVSQDAGFCNDRSVAPTSNTWESADTALGYSNNITYYGGYGRLHKSSSPQFVCPNSTNDLFTLSTSTKGNKKLTNPIGLLTADEMVYAGSKHYTTYDNYYLWNNEYWWTMTPFGFDGEYNRVIDMVENGRVDNDPIHYNLGVRPVINLKSSVGILDNGADGTISNPYIIKLN